LALIVLKLTFVHLIPFGIVKSSFSILFTILKRANEEVTSQIVINSGSFAGVLVSLPAALIKASRVFYQFPESIFDELYVLPVVNVSIRVKQQTDRMSFI
jgi:hypothetical protein